MLNHVRSLTALRQAYPQLGNYGPFRVYSAEKGSRLFAYKRDTLLVAVNPGREPVDLALDGEYRVVYQLGQVSIRGEKAVLARAGTRQRPCLRSRYSKEQHPQRRRWPVQTRPTRSSPCRGA